jgi:hypothetical protein
MDWVPGLTWGWLGPSGSLCNEHRTERTNELLPLLRACLSCELVCPCLTLYADGGGGSACTRRLRLDQLVVCCCLQDSAGNLSQLKCLMQFFASLPEPATSNLFVVCCC